MVDESLWRFRARQQYREEGRIDGWRQLQRGSLEREIFYDECRIIEGEEMGFMVADNGIDFELAPAGNHIAVCYSIVDLGIQVGDYQGRETKRHKVRLAWELSSELMADGRPFSIAKKYTASLSKTGNLLPDLESWRGRPFTPDELKGFDLKNVLGAPCMLNIIHGINSDNGRKYAKINSIAQLPRGMQRPMLINKTFFFSLTDADAIEKYNTMEDWLKKLINIESLRARMLPGSAENPTIYSSTDDSIDDDIPF